MGCVQQDKAKAPRTYDTSFGRAADHVSHLSLYSGFEPQRLHSGERRPWDLPAQHLNELGPRGYNYFRVTQTDELRRHHAHMLAQSKRSPTLRAKEGVYTLNQGAGYATRELTDLARIDTSASATSAKPAPAQRSDTVMPSFKHYKEPERFLPPPRELVSERPSMAELYRSLPRF